MLNYQFFSTVSRSLKECPNKTPYRNTFLEVVFGKVIYAQTCECLEGGKEIHFYQPSVLFSLLRFGSWVLTFVFWAVFRFSSEVHCELDTCNTVSNFLHLLSSPTVTSQAIFPTINRQFSRRLYDYEQ